MSDTAFQTLYRQEFIEGFEQHQSLVRDSVTTEANVRGNQAIFLVADSGSADATTRGANGLISARPDNQTQNTCTVSEWHDLVRKTRFTVDMSQGNQRLMMQKTAMAVLNRKIDNLIITELATATNDTGTADTASLEMVVHAKTILGNNGVPFDGNIFGLITPAFEGYLNMVKEFGSRNYVSIAPLTGADSAYEDKPKVYEWLGIKWIVHPNLPGAGTSAEQCFIYHRNAIGHAVDKNTLETVGDYNKEQDYWFYRATAFMGAKLLQNSGVVFINHDGSGFAAT